MGPDPGYKPGMDPDLVYEPDICPDPVYELGMDPDPQHFSRAAVHVLSAGAYDCLRSGITLTAVILNI